MFKILLLIIFQLWLDFICIITGFLAWIFHAESKYEYWIGSDTAGFGKGKIISTVLFRKNKKTGTVEIIDEHSSRREA